MASRSGRCYVAETDPFEHIGSLVDALGLVLSSLSAGGKDYHMWAVRGLCLSPSSILSPHQPNPTLLQKIITMAAVAQPTTYGCSPALLLSSKAGPSSAAAAIARSKSAPGETSVVTDVVVHPIVLLSVLDHHTRRQEGAGRVIGTLLGKRDGDRVSIFSFCSKVTNLQISTVLCVLFNCFMHNLHLVHFCFSNFLRLIFLLSFSTG